MTPTAAAVVPLCCPTHREPLLAADGTLRCGRDGETFPVVDGIPVLIADRAERQRVAGTDWTVAAAPSPLDFYNKVQGQDDYLLSDLGGARAQIESWLGAAQVAGAVLEIGSGKGVLQGIGGEAYVAADYSLTALHRYITPSYPRVCATAEHLPFADETFRFIFSIACLEHVPAADLAFDEIHRVLKPGGVAYLHPAWHCTQYNCDGIPVRPYRDLTWRQRWVKLILPVLEHRGFKAAAVLPIRLARRLTWAATARRPTSLRFRRLRPDYQTFWLSDSDAASRLDSHEACLFFQSRRYQLLAPGAHAVRQLLAGHIPLVVKKA
jgi:SAM-dependent methyltransferase